MLARTLTAFLLAATSITAWPIIFYPSADCDSEPLHVLHEDDALHSVGRCSYLPHISKSYSGGTADDIQKVLLYYIEGLCEDDAAHHAYSNHTINNNTNLCIPFKKQSETPLAYTFIEEHLPIPPKNITSTDATCNSLRVQS